MPASFSCRDRTDEERLRRIAGHPDVDARGGALPEAILRDVRDADRLRLPSGAREGSRGCRGTRASRRQRQVLPFASFRQSVHSVQQCVHSAQQLFLRQTSQESRPFEAGYTLSFCLGRRYDRGVQRTATGTGGSTRGCATRAGIRLGAAGCLSSTGAARAARCGRTARARVGFATSTSRSDRTADDCRRRDPDPQ